MKNVILIAPPAAGKGSVAAILKEHYGYVHISIGELLRDEIKSGSLLGNSIKNIVDSGGFVDDNMVKNLIKSKMASIETKPYVLDGYPRKINQVLNYESIISELNLESGKAYFLDIDEKTAMQRTLGRMYCPNCKATYNKYTYHKPKVDGICDNCLSKLELRADDTEETFKKRFNNYLKETRPLINYYKEKNNLIILDATKKTEDIVEEIILTLGE